SDENQETPRASSLAYDRKHLVNIGQNFQVLVSCLLLDITVTISPGLRGQSLEFRSFLSSKVPFHDHRLKREFRQTPFVDLDILGRQHPRVASRDRASGATE